MINTISIQAEVEVFLRQKLDERLEKVTEEQRAFFYRIWPKPTPREDLEGAIDLCDRTIRANREKDQPVQNPQ